MSSWPRAVVSPEPRPCGDHRRRAGRRRSRDTTGGSDREPDRPFAVASAAQCGVRRARIGSELAFAGVRRGSRSGGGGARGDAPRRHQRAFGHHAAQSGRGGAGRRVHRGGAAAQRRELHREHGRRAASAPTPTERASSRRWPGARTSRPAGRRCVVIGAGGAARAVVLALADAGASRIAVLNRTPERATTAAALAGGVGVGGVARFACRWPRPSGRLTWWSTPRRSAWRARRRQGRIRGCWHRSCCTRARSQQTSSTPPGRRRGWSQAAAAGARGVDGLGMLVHQAAAQLVLWTGEPAPVEAMWQAAEAAEAAESADPPESPRADVL